MARNKQRWRYLSIFLKGVHGWIDRDRLAHILRQARDGQSIDLPYGAVGARRSQGGYYVGWDMRFYKA